MPLVYQCETERCILVQLNFLHGMGMARKPFLDSDFGRIE